MARPLKKIDRKLVENLAAIGCSNEEIAVAVGCGRTTIFRRFGTVTDKGLQRFKTSIRRAQYQAMNNGNVAMMIWLGKQYLGQRDKFDIDVREVDRLLAEELARVSGTSEAEIELADVKPASEQPQ